jgi:SulP family sulfate permease
MVPAATLPDVTLAQAGAAAEVAFAIALIGLLEAISIGRAFAQRARTRFDADQEIVGQGLSNVVGGLFQAYPGSGSFTRSGLNAEAGARTPMAAVFSSAFLLAILLMFASVVAHIPVPALAGVILYVAWKLIAFREIAQIMRVSRAERAIIVATLLAGLLVRLEFAIYVGVILSLLIFLSRTSRPTLAISAPDSDGVFRNAQVYAIPECPQIVFTRLDGPLYFGSVEAVERAFRQIERQRPGQMHLVLVLKGVGDIDLPGGDALIEEARRRRARGGGMYIVARYPPLLARLRRLGVVERIGEENFFARKGDAVAGVVARLEASSCTACTVRIFRECAGRPGGGRAEGAAPDPSPDPAGAPPAAPV